MKARALFLDRDGVINVDYGHVCRTQDFQFLPGIFDLCRLAKSREFKIFVVTNQAGIAKGMYSELQFNELTRWMCSRFEDEGVSITKVYYCPFHPTAGIPPYLVDSPDRKPKPGMLLKAASEFNIDLPRSVLIGDKDTDIEAGVAAGVGVNLLLRSDGHSSGVTIGDAECPVIQSLPDAAPHLL